MRIAQEANGKILKIIDAKAAIRVVQHAFLVKILPIALHVHHPIIY